MSGTMKYLFRAANVWRRCAHYLDSASCDEMPRCIWRMFVFMSVIVTVWWSVGKFVVQQPLIKIVF